MSAKLKKSTVEVEVVISEEVLKKNKGLVYDNKKNILTYELDGNIPKEVSKELKEFLNGEVVGANQTVLFNPLINAINEMQKIKGYIYQSELSDEIQISIKEKCLLDHLSYDIDNNKYIFDFLKESIEGKSSDDLQQMQMRVEKEIEKGIALQHKNSHQKYKNGYKFAGSFNTSITASKKILKLPYITANKKIDAIFNLLKVESDNTKKALDINFKDSIAIEEEKKRLAQEKKDADKLAKIEELSESNKEQQAIIDKQTAERKAVQIKNEIRYTRIENISGTIVTTTPNLNLEGLISKKDEIEKTTFEGICNNLDLTILSEEVTLELKKIFTDKLVYWNSILDREIQLRKEKKVAEANAVKLETIKENAPEAYQGASLPFEEIEVETDILTDDEKFTNVSSSIQEFRMKMKEVNFDDDFYIKKMKQVDGLLLKIEEWTAKESKQYINYKNNNK